MRLTDENGEYRVAYNADTGTVSCKGIFVLRGKDGHRPVAEFFQNVVDESPDGLTLDIRNLKFLNSSGIATIAGFIVGIKKKGAGKLMIQCSKEHSWQERSARAMSQLMPGLELTFE